jgi:hypothetical protein
MIAFLFVYEVECVLDATFDNARLAEDASGVLLLKSGIAVAHVFPAACRVTDLRADADLVEAGIAMVVAVAQVRRGETGHIS